MSRTNTSTANSLPANIKSRVKEADRLLRAGNPDGAVKICTEILDDDLNNEHALFIMCRAFHDLKRPGLGVLTGQGCVSKMKRPESWCNLGLAYMQGYNLKAARACQMEALKLDPEYYPSVHNMAAACQHDCDPEEGMSWAIKARNLNPEDFGPVETMGFLNLMMHRWTPGWSQYNVGMGCHTDRQIRFDRIQQWNGTKGQTVVLYSEQGIGDEICFTQYVPEMMKDCNLIIETCQTMYNLFKSSFDCPVYPTHFLDNVDWLKDHKIDAKLSFSQGMEIYRARNEQFTGKPHLKVSEDKRKWWRAILSQYPGRKIGISWKAGLPETGRVRRTIDPMDMIPILNQDATFVCLEYKDPREDLERLKAQGAEILDFSSFINGHKDYEMTAALVAELDHVIAPTTAVVDLCGALGKSCDVFVPEKPFWRYMGHNIWYDSVRWIQQKGSWEETIQQYVKEVYARAA